LKVRIPFALAMGVCQHKYLKMKYYYYNPLVDKEPVEVKILQYRNKEKDRVEISRDFNSNAGFWVNTKELTNSPQQK